LVATVAGNDPSWDAVVPVKLLSLLSSSEHAATVSVSAVAAARAVMRVRAVMVPSWAGVADMVSLRYPFFPTQQDCCRSLPVAVGNAVEIVSRP
jgi:hypothetical protein